MLWEQGLVEYDELHGIDWQWQAMDGAMTKASALRRMRALARIPQTEARREPNAAC